MDANDFGYFTYDQYKPPCCVAEIPESFNQMWKDNMSSIIRTHLHDSMLHGLQPASALLPNGMSVGEAGMEYIRSSYSSAKKRVSRHPDPHALQQKLSNLLARDLGIDMHHHSIKFREIIPVDLFRHNNIKTQLKKLLKVFVREIRYRSPKRDKLDRQFHLLIAEL